MSGRVRPHLPMTGRHRTAHSGGAAL